MERSRTGRLVYDGGCIEWNRSGQSEFELTLSPVLPSFPPPSFPSKADPCLHAFDPLQITHIQFLTLLYPSELEARLIFGLLGSFSLSLSRFSSLASRLTQAPLLSFARPHRPSLFRHDLHLSLFRLNSSMGNDRSKHLQLSSLPPLHHRSLPLGIRRQSQSSLEDGWRNGCVRSGSIGAGCFEYGGEFLGGQGESTRVEWGGEEEGGLRADRVRFWLCLTGRIGRQAQLVAASALEYHSVAKLAGLVVVGWVWDGDWRG